MAGKSVLLVVCIVEGKGALFQGEYYYMIVTD